MTSKRRKWFIALACVACTITLAVVLTRNDEPRYQGRTLSEWVFDLSPVSSLPNPRTEEARSAIRAIGTNAIPHLFKFITCEPRPSRVRTALNWVRNRLPGFPREKSTWITPGIGEMSEMELIEYRRQGVPFAFEALGPAAAPAISTLDQLIQNQTNNMISWMATWSLAAISTNAQPVLLAKLRSWDPEQRAYAAHAFGLFSMARSNAEPAVPLLLDAIEDNNLVARYYAVWALGEIWIETTSDETLPALINALGDPEASVRRVATNALLKIAPEVLTNAPPQ